MKEQLVAFGHAALTALLPVLATLLTALIAMCGQKLHAYIDAKVKNAQLRGVLDRLNDTAWTVVTSVEQAVVSKVDPSKPLGDVAKQAQAAALAELKTHLGQKGIDEVKTVLGVGDSDIEKVLLSYIESKVHLVNQGQPQAPALPQPQPAAVAGGAA